MRFTVTIVYHEDYDELLAEIKKWDTLFSENSDLIFPGKDFKDIEKANSEKKTAIFFGFQNCSPIEDEYQFSRKSSQSRMQIYATYLQ
jgi:microsomal dipeptidase-like Zn-dependent dipeptidase